VAQAGPGPIYDLPCSIGPQISSKNTTFPGYKVGGPLLSLCRQRATGCDDSTSPAHS
jgi:hypothetical protein